MTPRTRLLGVDFGARRIGLAVSDADRRIASPLTVFHRRSLQEDERYFRQLVDDEQISGIVLGLPVHGSGREGQKAKEARTFGTWLGGITGLPVIFWDERFTTVEAEQFLQEAGLSPKQRKLRRDIVAAQILLQSYLDAGCPPLTEIGPLGDEGRS